MHDETVAIHGGYTPDTTRAVAVPVYQTIAHEFEDAAHAGAVFDLEIPGFHYNRLNNPTNSVLEVRLQALEGGTGAVVMSSGAAAVNYSIRTSPRPGTTSSRRRSFTAPPTPFSPMCYPDRASRCASPTTTALRASSH